MPKKKEERADSPMELADEVLGDKKKFSRVLIVIIVIGAFMCIAACVGFYTGAIKVNYNRGVEVSSPKGGE